MTRLAAAAGCAVVVACGSTAIAVPNGGGIPVPTMTAYATTGPATAAALAKDRWTTLPEAPIGARSRPAAVWDGQELLVWGGARGASDQPPQLGDGASYDPVTRQWAVLPPGPLSARSRMASVWTGHDLFMWGGDEGAEGKFQPTPDGAVYDPGSRTWHQLPPSPLAAAVDAQALWTGDEVVVIGGQVAISTSFGPGSAAAAYNPATGRWHSLPPIPLHAPGDVLTNLAAAAVGGRIYVWQTWEHILSPIAHETSTSFGLDIAVYNETSDHWTTITTAAPSGAAPANVFKAFWTGREFVIGDANTCPRGAGCPMVTNFPVYLWDPATNHWTDLPAQRTPGNSFWTGAALITLAASASSTGAERSAAWDPTTRTWTRLPDAWPSGAFSGLVAWAGERLLVWQPGAGLQLGP
jgi:hypothetical protein